MVKDARGVTQACDRIDQDNWIMQNSPILFVRSHGKNYEEASIQPYSQLTTSIDAQKA